MIHVRQTWHNLTQPSAIITEPDARQRARLLASLVLALMGIGAVALASPFVLNSNFRLSSSPSLLIQFFLLAGLVLIYLLSRTRYHRMGAWMVVAMVWCGIFGGALLSAGAGVRGYLTYLSVAILLAAMLLPQRGLLLVIAVSMGGILILTILLPFQSRGDVFYGVLYTLVLSGLLVVFIRHRDRLEHERQARLTNSEKRNRAMLDAIPDLMFRLSREGVYLDYEAGDSMDLYVEPEQFLGRSVRDVLPGELAQRLMEYVQRTLETGTLQVFEYDLPIMGVQKSFEGRMVTSGSDEVMYLVRNVTERKQGENALRESQERWRSLVENMPGYVTHINRDGTVLFLNRSRTVDVEQVVGTSVFDILPPEHRELVRQKVNDVFQTGKPDVYELAMSHPEGGVIWHNVQAAPVWHNGQVDSLIFISNDITEKKMAENALRASESRFRAMNDASPFGIFLTDAQGDCLYTNLAYQQISSLTFDEALGNGWNKAIHPDDRERVFTEWYATANQAQTRFETICRYQHPHGVVLWTSVKAVEIRDEETLLGYVGTVEDITERKTTQEALSQERNLLRTVIDHLPDYIFVKDRKGRFTLSNVAHARAVQSSPEGLIGKTAFDMFPAEAAAQFYADDETIMQSRQPLFHAERTTIDETGQPRQVLTTKVPLIDTEDRVIGLVGISHDITQRKQTEETLANERNLLRTLIDHLPGLIYVKDIQSRFLIVNPGVLRDSGAATQDELIGKSDFDLFPEAVAREFYNEEQAVIRSGQSVLNRESLVALPGGGARWQSITKVPLRNAENTIVGIVGFNQDITERKQAEASLAQERNLLRTLIDHLPVQIFVKDIQSRFIIINPDVLEDMGIAAPDELIGKSDFDFFPEAVAREFYDQEQAIIQTGQPILNQEKPITWPGGDVRWLSTTKVPLRNAENAVIGIVGFNQDITQRKQTEETLANERNLLRTLIDTMPYPVYVKDVESRFMIGNLAVVHGLGTTPEGIVGKTDFNFHPQNLAAAFYAEEQALLHSGAVQFNKEQDVFNQRIGAWECILSTKVPFYDSQGRIAGLVGVNHDITERKKTEEALANERNLLRTLIDAIPDFVYVKDTQSHYILTNTAHAQSMGSTPNEVVGRGDFDFFPQELAETYYADEQEVFRTGEPLLNHEEVSMKEIENLTLMIASSSKLPLRNSNGEIIGLVGITRDITEDKRVASQLEEARDQALESSRLKSEFLATMSHEIRTPMNGVIGMTELLLGTTLDEEQQDYARIVLGEANGLLTIINDILDFSKIEAGKMLVETIEFTLNDVVKRVVDVMKLKAADKGLSVVLTIAPDVPRFVCGDPNRLRQILLNLVGNAVKFTRRGEIEVQVTLDKYDAEHPLVRFAISDTGIGLSEIARKRLFQPFTQADGSTTRKYGGTGLGLVISKRLTELMGGEIGVESEEGQGSIFWFTIQFAASAQADLLHDAQPDQPDSQSAGDKSEFLILIAEDNPTNQSLALKQLRNLGYRARLVGNGVEAVDEVVSHPGQYALILMDCQMPVMDGYEAARLIRVEETDTERHIPIIALTASATTGIREKCLAAGMDDYLSKPVSLEALQAAIEHCLSQ